jgi:hypothetical protein
VTDPYPFAAKITYRCALASCGAGCHACAVKASRWEILGAWLRIWTPPRDVDIPPVPRRALAVVAVLLGAAIVVGLTLIAPAIDRGKQRDAARAARADAAFERRERARLTLDQRPRTARAPQAAALHAARRDGQARAALLADVRARIMRDARARAAAGTLEGTVRSVRCRYRAGEREPPRVYLACLAVTTQTAVLRIGQPFVVAGSLRDGRYAWCHENPRPAEGASGASITVPLPAACTA